MQEPRSYLFVPGHRPDRFAKAAAAGAGAVILDLEDAVGPEMKAEARAHVRDWLGAGGQAIVRINAPDTPWYADDLIAITGADCPIMVPKAEPGSLAAVSKRLPGRSLIALVETVAGLASLRESVRLRAVSRLAFGNLDFGADARIPDGGATLDPARFEIVIASRLGNLPPPIDGVTTALSDPDAIASDVGRARGMGFGAKLCIHPSQVAVANRGFGPTPDEVDWARRIQAALAAAAGSAVQMDGKMVDRPLIDRARHILAGVDAALP